MWCGQQEEIVVWKDTDMIWVQHDTGKVWSVEADGWAIDGQILLPSYAMGDAGWYTMSDISVEEHYVYMLASMSDVVKYYMCAPRGWWDEQQRN